MIELFGPRAEINFLLVGGSYGSTSRPSKVVKKLFEELHRADHEAFIQMFNGTSDYGSLIPAAQTWANVADLTIWMPNIPNEMEKHYIKKKQGSTLVVSKVIREGYTDFDAVSRIFKMGANAVIAIHKDAEFFSFKLLDALGNMWCDTTSISILAKNIYRLHLWSQAQLRVSTIKGIAEIDPMECASLPELCELVRGISQDIQGKQNSRYFGNASTRCGKLFPSVRAELMFVSKRNVSKEFLTPEDFVAVNLIDHSRVKHFSKDKPSVDTPIQMGLYNKLPRINYMIHGHAYIKDIKMTDEYFPCGDLRELATLLKNHVNPEMAKFAVNLKNHGFIIGGHTVDDLKGYTFIPRDIGEPI
jgi:hypothetical protein